MDAKNRPDVEKLEQIECWHLLESHVLARLAVVVDGHPDIFPVNYVVDNRSVVFRTASGTKFLGALESTPVAMEIDGYDSHTELAWSVVLRGAAREVRRQEELSNASVAYLDPWQGGPKEHVIRVNTLNLSGRRFKVTKPEIWKTPLSDPRRASFE
ncbi:pyridoxamine 5'-phosphate oxidase family protein [Paenarthrobacter sp. Z7-10]|uniref:pyridoxamine 5'-phosphate oxidase family protein n=1 Tax=Paenarthrobacter sp. Z7-10 TaxID=2787635 RepID=UPI0022A92DE4|nr:pyridoxamine 5'-phosphate oxidase family protein [Paenarthrobacter sp. Z7-10]MCZ2402032.1 pyridoxamine 5'-phosphate oxidase family protein [Paenarthrobacter sp. Z7-10]